MVDPEASTQPEAPPGDSESSDSEMYHEAQVDSGTESEEEAEEPGTEVKRKRIMKSFDKATGRWLGLKEQFLEKGKSADESQNNI